jgi:predicted nucleotidyltransferase
VFSISARALVRDSLIGRARADERIEAAAIVGSAAADREDEWSDIDLALRLAPGIEVTETADQWTAAMYQDHDVVDHLDIWSRRTLFRVFLLADTLQVDLSFWPAEDFAATGPAFRLIFGAANEPVGAGLPGARMAIGMGWLYALHARSSLRRGRRWQAVYMINGIRDHVVELACMRHGLPAHQGRGVDALPGDITAALARTLVSGLDDDQLRRAFHHAAEALLAETEHVDPQLGARLSRPILELVRTAQG